MNQLLDLAIEAYGELERWRAIERLDVSLSFSGFSFLRMKGYPEGLPDITPDRLWTEDDKGRVLNQRIEPRASFAGDALETPWDQLQLLYFDHETFSGLVFPTLRRVVLRTPAGRALSRPTAILLQIANVAVVPDQSSKVSRGESIG